MGMFCFKDLHRQSARLIVSSQGFEFVSKLIGVLLSNRRLKMIFVILEVVFIIPFIRFFPEINSSSFLDLFFSYKYVHHDYGWGYESLKSLSCGSIFFNSVPCVFSFLFLEEKKIHSELYCFLT